MKKTLLFLGLASVMLGFTGCAKDDVDNGAGNTTPIEGMTAPETLVASMGDGATRTALSPTGKTAMWTKGDRIAIYTKKDASDKVRKINYVLSGEGNSTTGSFTKAIADAETFVSVPVANNGSGVAVMRYVAVYPFANFWWESYSPTYADIGATIPSDQTYVKNGYDPKALAMISLFEQGTSGEAVNLNFRYMTSLLCMPVTGDPNVTFDQIVITNIESGRNASLAGRANLHCEMDNARDGQTSAERLANYTDTKAPLKGVSHVFDPKADRLTMTGTAAEPLKFGAEQTKIYFGILPQEGPDAFRGDHYVTFYLSDFSKFTKKFNPTGEVHPGDVCTLPAISVAPPYFSDIKYDAQTKKLSWTKNDLVESFSVVVVLVDQDKELATITPKKDPDTKVTPNEIDVEKDIYPLLAGSPDLKVNQTADIEYVVRATLADKSSGTTITYSIPYSTTYTKGVPELNVTADPDTKSGVKFNVVNKGDFDKGGVTYAFIQKKNAVEADFAAETFKPIPGMWAFTAKDLGMAQATDYTMMIKATSTPSGGGAATVKTAFVYVNYTKAAAKLDFVIANVGSDYLDILNLYDDFGLGGDAVTIYSAPGYNVDMSNTTGMTSYAFDNMLNIDSYVPAGTKSGTPWTFKAVVQYEGKEISAVVSSNAIKFF